MAETFTKIADDWVKATRPDGAKASGVRVGASRLAAAGLLTVQETGRKLWPTVETPSAAIFLLSQVVGGPVVKIAATTKRAFGLPWRNTEGASPGLQRHVPKWMTLGQVFGENIERSTTTAGRDALRNEVRFVNVFEGGTYAAVSYKDGQVDEYFFDRPNASNRVKIATITSIPVEAFFELADSVMRSRKEAAERNVAIKWQNCYRALGYDAPDDFYPQEPLIPVTDKRQQPITYIGTSAFA